MENEVKKMSRFEFLITAVERLKRWNIEGSLPIYILGAVIIYNFIFFSIFDNYGLYIFIPIAMAAISYYLKYWETDVPWRLYLGFVLVQMALFWDFLVSASYIPNFGSYEFTSLPTLLLDTGGMFVGLNWWMEYKDDKERLVKLDIKKDEKTPDENK